MSLVSEVKGMYYKMRIFYLTCLFNLVYGRRLKAFEDNYKAFNKTEKVAIEKGRSWITEGVWRDRCAGNDIIIVSGIALFCYDKMEMPITHKR